MVDREGGWRSGHPRRGWYYFFRGNGYGGFDSREQAHQAWQYKFEKDRFFLSGIEAHFWYFA